MEGMGDEPFDSANAFMLVISDGDAAEAMANVVLDITE